MPRLVSYQLTFIDDNGNQVVQNGNGNHDDLHKVLTQFTQPVPSVQQYNKTTNKGTNK